MLSKMTLQWANSLVLRGHDLLWTTWRVGYSLVPRWWGRTRSGLRDRLGEQSGLHSRRRRRRSKRNRLWFFLSNGPFLCNFHQQVALGRWRVKSVDLPSDKSIFLPIWSSQYLIAQFAQKGSLPCASTPTQAVQATVDIAGLSLTSWDDVLDTVR